MNTSKTYILYYTLKVSSRRTSTPFAEKMLFKSFTFLITEYFWFQIWFVKPYFARVMLYCLLVTSAFWMVVPYTFASFLDYMIGELGHATVDVIFRMNVFLSLASSSLSHVCSSPHSRTVRKDFPCSSHEIEMPQSVYASMSPLQVLCCENHQIFLYLELSLKFYIWHTQRPSFCCLVLVYVHQHMLFCLVTSWHGNNPQ